MDLDTLLTEDGFDLLLEDGGRLLLESATAEEASAPPGGTFRRALPTWRRTVARRPTTWPRTVSRSLPTLARVWRYSPMPLATKTDAQLIAAVSDDRDYGFDLRALPELAAGTGVTITSGELLGGAGLTTEPPVVLDQAFDGIPAGLGLRARISGGTAGVVYQLACRVTLSNGRKVTVPGQLSKVADYGA